MSDAHGSYKAMVQCLERSGFNNNEDMLYYCGDIVDGFPQIKECIDLLLNIKNLIYICGNHDQWTVEYYTGILQEDTDEYSSWQYHGGLATRQSYDMQPMVKEHLDFLLHSRLYHVTDDNILFVHAGFDTTEPLETNDSNSLLWNRSFTRHYFNLHVNNYVFNIDQYKEVYVGHTPTTGLDDTQTTPLQMGNIILMDTGACFTGCLSIMDIDSKEVWQSDKSMLLYPDHKGRNSKSWNEKRIEMGI
jgi:serine/threonine protein phosphatase 1